MPTLACSRRCGRTLRPSSTAAACLWMTCGALAQLALAPRGALRCRRFQATSCRHRCRFTAACRCPHAMVAGPSIPGRALSCSASGSTSAARQRGSARCSATWHIWWGGGEAPSCALAGLPACVSGCGAAAVPPVGPATRPTGAAAGHAPGAAAARDAAGVGRRPQQQPACQEQVGGRGGAMTDSRWAHGCSCARVAGHAKQDSGMPPQLMCALNSPVPLVPVPPTCSRGRFVLVECLPSSCTSGGHAGRPPGSPCPRCGS